jgi:uncharacterized protein YfaS (alpha-2-macroglobulin family)
LADKPDAEKRPPSPLTQTLGGAERFHTVLSTDKPVYKPGEQLRVRAVVLNAADRRPAADGVVGVPRIEIKGPKGDTVGSGFAQCHDGVVAFGWDIPAEQAGGEYTVKVMHPWTGHAPAERKFDIRAYRAPRLKTDIVFVRDGYGPGDKVTASLHAERAEGGIPAGAKVTVVARVDGAEVFTGPAKIDDAGNASAAFDLPREIARGDGTLAFVIEDGGVTETASKTIPILLQTVDLKVFPEGGDLVAGVANGVYLEARTPAQKPADIAGQVFETAKGRPVAEFRTSHEGRGRFEFTPAAGIKYALRITEPAGIKTAFPLPEAKAAGIALSAPGRLAAGEPVKVRVASPTAGKATVILSKREAELARVSVELSAGAAAEASLVPPAGNASEGVLTVTALDAAGKPVAERLVFRTPARPLNVTVTADKVRTVPADKVTLTVKTADADGKPVSVVVGLAVTDDSVQKMIEKRERPARLPALALLEPEVRELMDPEAYLDASDPKSGPAMDLLLGTQGWRRFALVNLDKFLAEHGDAGRRAVALRLQTQQEVLKARGDFGRPGAAGGAVILEEAAKAAADGAPAAAVPPPAPVPANRPVPAEKAPAPVAQDKKKADAQADRPGPVEVPAQAGQAAAAPAAPVLGPAVPPAPESKEREQLRKNLDRAGKREAAERLLKPGADEDAGPNNLALVREYAHKPRPDRRGDDRADFTETLYWNAALKTDAKTGEATVSFFLSDAVTTFRVAADALSADGSLGRGDAAVESVRPFYAEPKLPLEVTAGDRLLIPVAVVNATPSRLASANIQTAVEAGKSGWAGELRIGEVAPFAVEAGARDRRLIPVSVGLLNGSSDLAIRVGAGEFSDTVVRPLKVRPFGFPAQSGFGGLLGPAGATAKPVHEVVLPADVVARSVETYAAVYPTPLANLTEALESLIHEPCGCFEQTSSTTYPLTMAQQYFLSHQGVDPKLIERSRDILERGYKRLVGFECKGGGYEWFGADPGHEALTAYGLLQFTDMAQVRQVDSAMMARTRAWLLAQRDGKGGFARKTHTYHTWVSTPEVAAGYCTWALLECGEKGLDKEVAYLKEAAAGSRNSYVLAQAANVLHLAGDAEGAKALMDRLVARQEAGGAVGGTTETMVGSGGDAAAIETTALAVLAWLREPAYAGAVEKSMKWLAEQCKGGRLGSTQSTVLGLRAIVAYDKARARPKAPGKVRVIVDGRPVGGWVPFGDAQREAIKLPDFSELMTAGRKHTVSLEMEGGGDMPYSLMVKWNAVKPATSTACKLTVATALSDKTVAEGGLTEANVTVTNTTQETVPTPVAIVGLPGGLEPRIDQLKELVKAGRIAAFEVIGREVVFYWRALKPGEKVTLPISLAAAVPGTYTGPASRAYLYYTDEHKVWADGLSVEITPRGGAAK